MNEPILQAFLSLSVVVGLLIAVMFIIKRLVKNRNSKSNSLDLQIISKASIMPKSHLFVVKAENKTLLVGATDHNISLIADLTNDEQQSSFEQKKPLYKDAKSLALRSNVAKTPRQLPRETIKQPINQKIMTKKELEKSLSFSTFLKSAFKKA